MYVRVIGVCLLALERAKAFGPTDNRRQHARTNTIFSSRFHHNFFHFVPVGQQISFHNGQQMERKEEIINDREGNPVNESLSFQSSVFILMLIICNRMLRSTDENKR